MIILQAVTRDQEVQAEDEQGFLAKQLALLQQGGAPTSRTESPLRTPAGVQKTGERRVQGSPSVQGSPKKVFIFLFVIFLLTKSNFYKFN
jgi:hypothetical protein